MIWITLTTETFNMLFTSSSTIVKHGLDTLLRIPFFLVLAAPWISLIMKSRITKIIFNLGLIDAELEKYFYYQKHQLVHLLATLFTIMSCFFPVVILASIRGVAFWINNFSVITFIAYTWTGGLFFSAIFNLLIYSVVLRLEAINYLLQQISNSEKLQSEILDEHVAKKMRLIESLSNLHDILCDVATHCTTCFAVPIVLVMLHILILQILTAFAFLRVVFYHLDAAELNDSVFYMIGAVSYSLLSTSCILLAGVLRRHTIITWKLTHRIINVTKSILIEDRLQRFSEQMNHRVPNVDCWFFVLDWPFFLKVCSEAATYLIILIQFESKL
ncbi:uncharacterized protein LOC128720979 [Anopheles nili]|uniref:uncharacterized protein LOC128720979 n=1 Tax=Anopheles nili TaxID=185578 RepID=UPI00237A61FB|nr:uncharacterized protein LOC128720979 [Anopheles nili]